MRWWPGALVDRGRGKSQHKLTLNATLSYKLLTYQLSLDLYLPYCGHLQGALTILSFTFPLPYLLSSSYHHILRLLDLHHPTFSATCARKTPGVICTA